MSQQDKHKREPEAAAPAVSPAEVNDKASAKPDASKPGIKYVFKIAPADPKRNSIDFEDVADK